MTSVIHDPTTRRYQTGDRIGVAVTVQRLLANVHVGQQGVVHGYTTTGQVEVLTNLDSQLHTLSEDEIAPADVKPADWTQDDLLLVTRRATGLRGVADFIEDNPQLARHVRHGLDTLRIYVSDRATIEAFIAAARERDQPVTEFADENYGGVEIHCAGAVLRVYATLSTLAGMPQARPAYRPLLGAERTDADRSGGIDPAELLTELRRTTGADR